MAQGNHFLNIPKQEGLFTTIKSGRAGESRDDSPVDDEDEEETEEDVRFIPRCSPVPRKRGPSIADETAEYMRIRLALPQRRVSFADATGGELVDVREFAAFDSGDDEDNANWEEEEAKCRRTYLQPVYRLWPEFQAHVGSDLTLAVRSNKVEVEKVTVVQEDPLSFDALICVLNVSYHKCVYVRATMDGWITHSDSAAEYVQGSYDGDTDKFSARLSFAEPYLFNGARIDFVVRYETSDGEFWANNSGRNYSVTLVVSYDEEDTAPDNTVDDREIKSILKPARYRAEDDSDFYPDTDDGNEHNTERGAAVEIPLPVCPLVIKPEIDIEIPEALIAPAKTKEDPTLAELPPLSADRKDEHPLQDLTENPLQTDHLDKGQGTELLITTEYVISVHNEAPDNDPTSDSDRYFMHSAKFSQPFCPNKENPQSDLDITLPAIFPSIQDMEENDSEELKDHKENDALQSGERREAQLQDQSSHAVEVGDSESSLQEPQESTQQCSLNESIPASASKGDFIHSAGHDMLFEESHEPLLESPEMQMMKHDTMIRRETSGKEQADLMVGEVPDMIASCMWQPFEPTNLEQTREEHVIQNVPSAPRTPDLEVTKYQEQDQRPEPALSVNVDTPYESTAAEEESPMLTSLPSATGTPQFLTTTEHAVTPEVGDGKAFITQEEPSSNDKCEFNSDDPALFQKQEELEIQPALPCKTLEASAAEVDGILVTLIPSFAFLSATVCLIVGFHEPSIFLIVALFLVSLCF
ncbi:hypothetical protein QTP70_019612 [Hemibagrus guttatus]|uniref:CBM21 domain-containing protein n=1 Tax=Hemibagrus guttatus TaxID=175788 RepID=A0AAE0V470_9TELE|nr:hypothetical protein QTP70_019612 [Hemibagrus guttatus]